MQVTRLSQWLMVVEVFAGIASVSTAQQSANVTLQFFDNSFPNEQNREPVDDGDVSSFDALLVSFDAFGTQYALEVTKKNIVSERYTEATLADGDVVVPSRRDRRQLPTGCMYQGFVTGNPTDTLALVSICNGDVRASVRSEQGQWLEITSPNGAQVATLIEQSDEDPHEFCGTLSEAQHRVHRMSRQTQHQHQHEGKHQHEHKHKHTRAHKHAYEPMSAIVNHTSTHARTRRACTSARTMEIVLLIDYAQFLADGSVTASVNNALAVFQVMNSLYGEVHGNSESCSIELVLVGTLVATTTLPSAIQQRQCDETSWYGTLPTTTDAGCCSAANDVLLDECPPGLTYCVNNVNAGCDFSIPGCISNAGTSTRGQQGNSNEPWHVRTTIFMNSGCQYDTTSDADPGVMLFTFRAWIRDKYDTLIATFGAVDAMPLLSGLEFAGTTVGIAHVDTVCGDASWRPPVFACNVNEHRGRGATAVAEIVVHEIGHNLGLHHVASVCSVMSAFTCNQVGSVSWSQTSKNALNDNLLQRSNRTCLSNVPSNPGGDNCGDGLTTGVEDCDIGVLGGDNPCVDGFQCSSTCRFEFCTPCPFEESAKRYKKTAGAQPPNDDNLITTLLAPIDADTCAQQCIATAGCESFQMIDQVVPDYRLGSRSQCDDDADSVPVEDYDSCIEAATALSFSIPAGTTETTAVINSATRPHGCYLEDTSIEQPFSCDVRWFSSGTPSSSYCGNSPYSEQCIFVPTSDWPSGQCGAIADCSTATFWSRCTQQAPYVGQCEWDGAQCLSIFRVTTTAMPVDCSAAGWWSRCTKQAPYQGNCQWVNEQCENLPDCGEARWWSKCTAQAPYQGHCEWVNAQCQRIPEAVDCGAAGWWSKCTAQAPYQGQCEWVNEQCQRIPEAVDCGAAGWWSKCTGQAPYQGNCEWVNEQCQIIGATVDCSEALWWSRCTGQAPYQGSCAWDFDTSTCSASVTETSGVGGASSFNYNQLRFNTGGIKSVFFPETREGLQTLCQAQTLQCKLYSTNYDWNQLTPVAVEDGETLDYYSHSLESCVDTRHPCATTWNDRYFRYPDRRVLATDNSGTSVESTAEVCGLACIAVGHGRCLSFSFVLTSGACTHYAVEYDGSSASETATASGTDYYVILDPTCITY